MIIGSRLTTVIGNSEGCCGPYEGVKLHLFIHLFMAMCDYQQMMDHRGTVAIIAIHNLIPVK